MQIQILIVMFFSIYGFTVFLLASLIRFKSILLKAIVIILIIVLAMSAIYSAKWLPLVMILWVYASSAFGLIGVTSLAKTRNTRSFKKHSIQGKIMSDLDSNLLVVWFSFLTIAAVIYWGYIVLLGFMGYAIGGEIIDGYLNFIYGFIGLSALITFVAIFSLKK